MRFIISIPLFFYLLIVANIAMFTGNGEYSSLNIILSDFVIISGARILITVSDALIIAAVVFLYIETFKATRTSVGSIIDHAVSLLVFVIFLVEFLVIERVGNTTFLIIMIASLMDVILGFTVTISTAKRDISFG